MMILKKATYNFFDHKLRYSDKVSFSAGQADDNYAVEAITMGNLAQLKKITESGFSLTKAIPKKYLEYTAKTLLILASSGYYPEITRYILSKDSSNINDTDNEGKTAIMKAFTGYHSDSNADVLLEYPLDLNIQDNNNKSVVDYLLANHNLDEEKKINYYSKFLEKGLKMDPASESTKKIMFLAAQTGRTEILEKYLQLKGSPDIRTSYNDTLAMSAVKAKQPEIAMMLLDSGADINLTNDANETLLFGAALIGYSKLVSKILKKNNNVNLRNKDLETPLMKASESGSVETLSLILDKKPDLFAKDSFGNTALMKAAEKGKKNVISKLIQSIPENKVKEFVNEKNKVNKTALMLASIGGYDDVINLLLDNQANLEDRSSKFEAGSKQNYDPGGRTALILAIRNRHSSTTELLLNRGADIENADDDLQTPLMNAANVGAVEPAKTLISRNANLNKVDKDRMSALMHAVYIPLHYQNIVKELINAKAELNLRDKNGYTAIMHASKANNIEWVKDLADAGATFTADDVNKSGMYTLMVRYNEKYAEKFLINGVNIDIPDKDGNTPLLKASQSKQLEKVKFHLSHKANVNHQNNKLQTALMLSCQYEKDNVDIVNELLNNEPKPDLELKDKELERTALMYFANKPKSLEAILNAGARVDNVDKLKRTFLMYISILKNPKEETIDIAMKYIPENDRARIINMKDSNNKTAIDYAVEKGLTHVLKVLLENGAIANKDVLKTAETNKWFREHPSKFNPFKFFA